MRKKLIEKKTRGMWRTIYVPSTHEKELACKVVYPLWAKVTPLLPDFLHGFQLGKSPVTNAQAHIGEFDTLCMDISDFFDSVTRGSLMYGLNELHNLTGGRLGEALVYARDRVTCPRISDHNKEGRVVYRKNFIFPHQIRAGRLKGDAAVGQGLPTSPFLANVAGITIDKRILKILSQTFGSNFRYTRYADDLSISYPPEFAPQIQDVINKISAEVALTGFDIKPSKTRIQTRAHGRRVITGVSVGDTDVSIPRRVRRKLRAARHQGKDNVVKGFEEWCALRTPRPLDLERSQIHIRNNVFICKELLQGRG